MPKVTELIQKQERFAFWLKVYNHYLEDKELLANAPKEDTFWVGVFAALYETGQRELSQELVDIMLKEWKESN